jgi:septin 2
VSSNSRLWLSVKDRASGKIPHVHFLEGESGLGKATLIDSLFLSNLYPQRRIRSAYGNSMRVRRRYFSPAVGKLCSSVQIETSTVDIEERGVKVRLTIIDTPGYGDRLDNSDACPSIVNYIDEQFKRFYDDENSPHRRTITDHRVHCLLYFISPFARGSVRFSSDDASTLRLHSSLKPLDLQCLRALHERVNVIPVIAKADALTSTELLQMKQSVGAKRAHPRLAIGTFRFASK